MTLTPSEAQTFLTENFAEWVRALDLTIADIGPQGATLRMPITPRLARVGGILSGQALAAMADTAMVFACAEHMGGFRPVATTNLDTVFLRPGNRRYGALRGRNPARGQGADLHPCHADYRTLGKAGGDRDGHLLRALNRRRRHRPAENPIRSAPCHAVVRGDAAWLS